MVECIFQHSAGYAMTKRLIVRCLLHFTRGADRRPPQQNTTTYVQLVLLQSRLDKNLDVRSILMNAVQQEVLPVYTPTLTPLPGVNIDERTYRASRFRRSGCFGLEVLGEEMRSRAPTSI